MKVKSTPDGPSDFNITFTARLVWIVCLLTLPRILFGDSVALFYALDKDLEVVREELTEKTSHAVGDRTVHEFRKDGHEIYAIKMGSGCITTAVSTTSLLMKFPVDHAFSLGPAAGIAEFTEVGAWYFVETHASYQIGSVKQGGFVPSGQKTRLVNPEIRGVLPATATSGERFIASTSERNRLAALTGAQLLEMNLEGLIQPTQSFGVPLICIRVISDLGDNDASSDFARFLDGYDGDGASLFLEWLNSLPPNLDSLDAHKNLKNLFEGVDLGLDQSSESN